MPRESSSVCIKFGPPRCHVVYTQPLFVRSAEGKPQRAPASRNTATTCWAVAVGSTRLATAMKGSTLRGTVDLASLISLAQQEQPDVASNESLGTSLRASRPATDPASRACVWLLPRSVRHERPASRRSASTTING